MGSPSIHTRDHQRRKMGTMQNIDARYKGWPSVTKGTYKFMFTNIYHGKYIICNTLKAQHVVVGAIHRRACFLPCRTVHQCSTHKPLTTLAPSGAPAATVRPHVDILFDVHVISFASSPNHSSRYLPILDRWTASTKSSIT